MQRLLLCILIICVTCKPVNQTDQLFIKIKEKYFKKPKVVNEKRDPFKTEFFDKYITYRWPYLSYRQQATEIIPKLSNWIKTGEILGVAHAILEYPIIYDRFDIIVGYRKEKGESFMFNNAMSTLEKKPILMNSMFCFSLNLSACLQMIKKIPVLDPMNKLWMNGTDHRALIIGGDANPPLSKVHDKIMFVAKSRFNHFYYENKDMHSDYFKLLPKGFLAETIAFTSYDIMRTAYTKTNTYDMFFSKPFMICAGLLSDVFELEGVYEHHFDMLAHLNLQKSSLSFNYSIWSIDEYWHALSTHNFVVVPRGIQEQSSYLFDAWFMKTIPIVLVENDEKYSAFVELYEMGYPLYITKSWSSLTTQSIHQWFDKERFKIDWHDVRYMLTVKHHARQMLDRN